MLEIAALGHIPIAQRKLGLVGVQRGANFGGCPDVKRAFFAFAVGILGSVKTAVGTGHVAQNIGKGFFGDAAEKRVAGCLKYIQIQARQQRIIVQHFLEVWHQPIRIHRIAGETAAQLVVDAAVRHRSHGVFDLIERGLVAGAMPMAQHHFQHHRLGKLGRIAITAKPFVILAHLAFGGVIEQSGIDRSAGNLRIGDLAQVIAQLGGAGGNIIRSFAVGAGHAVQHLGERWQTVARFGREIRAAIKRRTIRREKHRHRPTTVARHRLHRRHINRVNIGSFLAIYLDIDKIRIHNRRRRLILKAFTFHNVTPVAGTVTHA